MKLYLFSIAVLVLNVHVLYGQSLEQQIKNADDYLNKKTGGGVSCSQIWANLHTADDNLTTLVNQPNNDPLYNNTRKILLQVNSDVNHCNCGYNDLSQITAFIQTEISPKTSKVDELRKASGNTTTTASAPSAHNTENPLYNIQATSQPSATVEGIKNQGDYYNKEYGNKQYNIKPNNSTGVKKMKDIVNDPDDNSSFDNVAIKPEQVADNSSGSTSTYPAKITAISPPLKDAVGYTKFLYNGPDMSVSYTLKEIDHRDCYYFETTGTSIAVDDNGSHVVENKNQVYFRGYYYKATYTITNKKNKKIYVKGWIDSAPYTDEPRGHILPVGDVGTCLGFDKEHLGTFSDHFNPMFDFYMTDHQKTDSGFFWSEIADEPPNAHFD